MAINLNEFFNQAAQQSEDPGVEAALSQYDAGAEQVPTTQSPITSLGAFNQLGQQQAKQAEVGRADAFGQMAQRDLSFYDTLQQQPDPTYKDDPSYYATKPGDIARDDASRASRSLIAGFGQLSTQVGDMFTAIQALSPGSKYWLPYNDPIGNFFRGAGEELTSEFQNTYVPKELEEITFSDLGNPTFWAGDVAQQIPNLMAMMGAGAAGAKGVGYFMRKHAAKQVAKGAGKAYGVGVQGAKGLETLSKGRGLFGQPSLFTKIGKNADDIILSDALGKGIASTVGGGLGSTIIDGAMVAGQEYRHALEMGLTPEQAGSAAAGVFGDNAKWLGVNMLSWGATFGRLPGRLGVNVLNKSAQQGAKTFAQRAAHITANVAPRVAFESVEEMYQESYQDWIQKKNLARVQGKKFVGKNGEDYEGFNGYINYFGSKENQRTKLVSFATGMIGGGLGGIVNSMADRQSALDKQEERLKDGVEQDAAYQIESTIQNAVENEMSPMLINYLNELKAEGKMSDGLLEQYVNTIEFVQEKYDNIPGFMDQVTGAGKARILDAKLQIEKQNNAVSFEEQQLENWKKEHSGQEETKEYKATLKGLESALESTKEVRDNTVAALEKEVLQIEREALDEIETFKKIRPDVDTEELGTLTQKQKEAYLTKDAEAKVKADEEAKVKAEEDTKTEEELGFVGKAKKGLETVGKTVKEAVVGKPSEEVVEEVVAEPVVEEETKKDESVKKVSDALNAKTKAEVKKEMPEEVDAAINALAEKYDTPRRNLSKEEKKVEKEFRDEIETRQAELESGKKKVEAKPVTKEAFDQFVETGEVSEGIIAGIAQKIKAGEKLTKEEESIRTSKSKEVESLLKEEVAETEEKVKVDDSAIKPKKKAPKPKKKPSKSKVKPSSEKTEEVEKTVELAEKYNVKSISGFTILQEKLGIPIGVLDPQTSPYGASMAMEASGAIFVTPNSLYQEQIVHELTGHIYFRINSDKPLIKEFVRKFIKTNEFTQIKAQYPELLMYNWFGDEMTLHEVVGDILSRSTDARSRFRNLEAINEARKKAGKPAIAKAPISEVNELILQKATEYYTKWNDGSYETVQGQAQLINDSQELTDLLKREKIGKVLPNSKQKGLHQEAWASYIADPGSGNVDNRARDIFANLFADPKQNKERKRSAKRFWNIVSKQGDKIKGEAKSILEMESSELRGLTLEQMKEKLRSAALTVTPEQLRSRRVTQSRIQLAKRDVSFTKATQYINAVSTEVSDYIIEEYNKSGSVLRKAIQEGDVKREMLVAKVIEASNKFGSNNPFHAYSAIDKYDMFIDGVIKKSLARVERLNPNAKIHQIVSEATTKALKDSANALLKDMGSEETIDEIINAGISIMADEAAQIWGIDNMDMEDMQDSIGSLRAESELAASSDNTLSIYNKERDSLITTLSAMMADFERSYLSTAEGKGVVSRRGYVPFIKERSAGVLATLLDEARQSPNADAFVRSIRNNRRTEVRAFVKYLEGKFAVKPMLIMDASLKKEYQSKGSTNIYADYYLSNVWVNMKSKTHESLFSTVVKDKEGRENNTLELFNEADVAFEERQLIESIVDKSFKYYSSTAKDNPAAKKDNIFVKRRGFIADAKRIKENIDNDIDKDHYAEIVSLFDNMFNEFSGGYLRWNTLYKSGVNFKNKRYTLVDWFSNEGIKQFRESSNRITIRQFEDLFTQVAINSRALHYFTMLHNAENNPTNTMNTRSFILDQNERFNELFAVREGESKYDYNNRVQLEALRYVSENKINPLAHNHFLPFEIELTDEGVLFSPKQTNISFRGGLVTELRNSGLNYSRMSPQELMVSEMSDFFNAQKRKQEYSQGIAVFAEKTRMYYVQAPAFNTTQLNERAAWMAQYASQNYKDGRSILSLVDSNGKFNKAAVAKEVKLIKDHIVNQKHLYLENTAFSGLFDSRGNFTKQADSKIALYVKNYEVNSFAAQRHFIGDHSQFENEEDFSKRAAGSIARKVTPEKGVTLDLSILKKDPLLADTELENEDGQGYMLESDLKKDAAEFGLNLMRNDNDTAKHLKYVYYGQDLRDSESRLDNDIFGDASTLYLKGNVIAITPKMEEESTYLKKVAKHLRQRKRHLGGKAKVVAYNESAIKAFPGSLQDFSIDVDEVLEERMRKANSMHSDSMGQYKGLDGDNFGVQLPLDKEKYDAIMASQSYAQHLTNVTVEDKEMSKLLVNAHKKFARSMDLQLKESGTRKFFNIDEYSDAQQSRLNQGLLGRIHENWAGTPVANMSEYVSPFFPKVNMIRNAILNKMMIETGTKIQAPGTVAFQMTDRGFGLQAHITLGELGYVAPQVVNQFGKDLIVSEAIVPASMKKNYKIGDIILASRIPSHGKASQPVLIIKDFLDNNAGSLISIPAEVSKIMGSDLDGDALFVNGKYTSKKLKPSQEAYNQGWNSLVKLLGNAKFSVNETQKAINFVKDSELALEEVDNNLGKRKSWATESSQMLPMGRLNAFNENVPAGSMIGIAALAQRNLSYMAHYDAELDFSIKIGEAEAVSKFTDKGNSLGYYQTAQVLNIILDNPKHQFARKLGFTKQTINAAMILLRMGYSLGDVATILNSKAAMKYNKYSSERTVVYTDNKEYYTAGEKAIMEYMSEGEMAGFAGKKIDDSISFINETKNISSYIAKARKQLKVEKGDSLLIDIRSLKEEDLMTSIEVIKLLEVLSKVGTEVFNAGRVVGAYGLKIQNAFEVDKLVNDFNNVGTKDSLFKDGTLEDFKEDPLVSQNLKVLNQIKTLDKVTNLQYSSESIAVQEAMNEYVMSDKQNIFEKSPVNVRNYQLFRMRNELSVLKDMGSRDLIYSKIQSLVDNEYGVDENGNPYKNDDERNQFLTKAIVLHPETKSVRLNTRFIDAFISPSDLLKVQQFFNELDNPNSNYRGVSPIKNIDGSTATPLANNGENRKLFIQMDFLQNGWIGGNSTSVAWAPNVFGSEFNINDELNNMLADNNRNVGKAEAESLSVKFLEQFPYSAPSIASGNLSKDENGYIDNSGNQVLKDLRNSYKRHVVKSYNSKNKKQDIFIYNPEVQRYIYAGETSFSPAKAVNNDKTKKVVNFKKQSLLSVEQSLAAAKKIRNNSNLSKAKVKYVGDVKVGRVKNPAQFNEMPLSEDQYFKAKGITDYMRRGRNIDVTSFYSAQYTKYEDEHNSAFAYYKEFIENDEYKEFSDAELTEHALDFSKMDKVVHDNIMEFIGIELAERMESKQIATIADVAKKNGISLVNNDLGAWEAWLISNNLHQTNADVQSIVNKLEGDYQRFASEWRVQAKNIKRFSEQIIKDKTEGLNAYEIVKLKVQGKFNGVVWSGLVKKDVKENGKTYIRLKTEDELGKISEAERVFYDAFKQIIRRYYPEASETMVPHKSIGGFHALMRDGLYGLYRSSVNSTSDLAHIVVRGERPDGVTDFMPYKDWADIYGQGRGFAIETASNITKLNAIRKRAVEAFKRGTNDDGSPIVSGVFERKAFQESDVFFNFVDSKQVLESDLGTMDLEEIVLGTLHSNMYKHGLRNNMEQYLSDVPLEDGYREIGYNQWSMLNDKNEFLGMEANLPLIDGAIHLNKIRGNKEMVKYLNEVWRDNILGGKKQKTFGGSWDWAINSVVDLTSIAFLGFKPAIAVGNVVMGKYQQLRSRGGKEFALGEKRFWQGFMGGESLFKRGAAAVQQRSLSTTVGKNKSAAILNELMKFEFYQYENVSSVSKQNPLFRVALFPLDQSEKWIQGAMFFGMMTDKQWNSYDVNDNGDLIVIDKENALTPKQIRKMSYEVKKQQGFGYSPMDQRRMSLYSWGRVMGQFKRYFFTLGRERFGKETIDMYGNPDVGSYRAAFDFTRDMYNGKKSMKDFDKLPEFRRKAIERYLTGVAYAIGAMMIYGLTGDDEGDKNYAQGVAHKESRQFLKDQNVFFNPRKLMFMSKPPSVGFVQDRLGY